MPIFSNLDCYRVPPFTQITFSSGGSSAYKTWHIVEANGGIPEQCEIIFCNTGFEDESCLDFTADFERNVGVPITWVERDGQARTKFRRVGHNSASRDGKPFRELFSEHILRRDGTIGPRPLASDGPRRLCSGELKTKTAHRYLRAKGWGRYTTTLGFRADEAQRVARRRKLDAKAGPGVVEGGIGLFPLFYAGVTTEDVAAFGAAISWWHRPVQTTRGEELPATLFHNCTNCFMAAEWKMKERMAHRPWSVQPWIEMEGVDRGVDRITGRERNRYFRPGRKSMQQLFEEVQRGDFSVDPRAIRRRPVCAACTD